MPLGKNNACIVRWSKINSPCNQRRVDSLRQSTIANFLVIGGFAAFAFVVQYVLQTIAAANDWGRNAGREGSATILDRHDHHYPENLQFLSPPLREMIVSRKGGGPMTADFRIVRVFFCTFNSYSPSFLLNSVIWPIRRRTRKRGNEQKYIWDPCTI